MSGFAKLYGTITESSLWSASKETRILFITMLARCDETGFIEAAPSGLARTANLTLEETRKALEELDQPDPESKSKALYGRRVVKVDRGYMVVNYEEYRKRRDDVARREYMRDYMREYRKRGEPPRKPDVNSCKPGKPQLAQAEAEAEAEADKEKKTTTAATQKKQHKVQFEAPVGFHNVTDEKIVRWAEAYPRTDVKAELRRMVVWLTANPHKAATMKNYERFIVNWLSRSNEGRYGQPQNETDEQAVDRLLTENFGGSR
jgi:hypothetical protein